MTLTISALASGAASAGETASAPPKPVTVTFHWKAQAQWAGFYMAKEKGFYGKRGLDVTLQPRLGRSDPLDTLMEGKTTFATHFLSAALGARGAKQPVALVGQIFNRSNLMLVARRSEGVDSLDDLNGRSIAFWDGYYTYIFRAFLKSHGVDKFIWRPMGLTVRDFTSRKVQACSAMEYNEYHLILTSPETDEKDLVLFRLRDLGLDVPEDGLYTTEAYARANPETCRAMLEATLEGWAYARANPDETIAVVNRMVADDPDELVNEAHSRWMLEKCGDSVVPPPDSPRRAGVLSRRDFDMVHRFLKEYNQIGHDVKYEDFAFGGAVEN